MKKILLFLNVILLGIIGFMACNSSNSDHNASATSEPIDPCLAKFCREYPRTEPSGVIEGWLIDTMSGSYAADQGKGYITGTQDHPADPHNPNIARAVSLGQRDGLSMVFDLKKLKSLIWKMHKNACDNHCDSTVELGIRFYYIKYPLATGTDNPPRGLSGIGADVRNKHALVMVPVYKSKRDNEWYDYDLWNSGNQCFRPIINMGREGDDVIYFSGVGADAGDNHGGVGPPPETGTFPTTEDLN